MAAVIYGIMPMVLHRYPPGDALVRRRAAPGSGGLLAERSRSAMQSLTAHPALTLSAVAIAFAVVGAGVLRLNASVQVFQLLNEDADLIRDYAWLEKHLGNLVPMEVVVALPPERLRTGDEHAEADGQQYRMTMLDRLELLRQIERRLEAFPQISRALSATAFAPPATATGLGGANRSGDYAKNKALEFHAEKFLAGDYVSLEIDPATHRPTGRELWRLNARVAAMSAGNKPIDYSVFLGQLQRAVEPVLLAYQQRDQIVRALHEQGKQLAGSRVCVLFRAPGQAPAPPAEVQEQALAELLTVSGVAPRGVTYFNLATFEQPDRGNPAQDELFRTSALASLQKQDAVVLASAPSDPVARQIAASGVYVVNVTAVHKALESIAAPMVDDGGPRPIRAVFTGIAPVVEQTQQLLAASLVDNLAWAAVLAAVAITLGYMSLASGALTIGPALLPLAATLGAMGWLGFKIELGVAMTAGVALGVALEGGMHLIQWYRRGLATGLARREAVIWAHDRVSTTIVDAALIAAAGLAVFALSAFTPLRQFGVVMIVMQLAALATNLLVLPAILASPLGWFFAPVVARRADPLLPKLQNWWSSVRPRHVASHGAVLPLPKAPPAPHYGDQPVPRRTTLPISTSERRELSEGPHSALHAKLQGLRRPRAEDSAT
jgi:predicted RND superfamily exporter protein